ILDTQGEIVLEQTLDFIGRLSFKPFLGTKKVAVLNNAENLNIQSANALLKTLEEPSSSSIIILVAGPGRVLPTIFSRCQVLNFNVFSRKALEEFAKKFNLPVDQISLDLSFGRPGRLIRLVEDKGFLEKENAAVQAYQKL